MELGQLINFFGIICLFVQLVEVYFKLCCSVILVLFISLGGLKTQNIEMVNLPISVRTKEHRQATSPHYYPAHRQATSF